MFIGHFGFGFGAKRYVPKVSLGTLFFAAQFLDLLWPVLLLLGIEQAAIDPNVPAKLSFSHYPYSHSLLLVLVWAALFGAVYFWRRRDARIALVLGALVVSHWVLDLLVHDPDLPLWPGGPLFGLGLWHQPGIELAVEGLLFVVGVVLYLRSTRANDRIGSFGAWALIACLVFIHVANSFSPPPPSINAVAWAGNLQWLFVALAWWVDQHRSHAPSITPAAMP